MEQSSLHVDPYGDDHIPGRATDFIGGETGGPGGSGGTNTTPGGSGGGGGTGGGTGTGTNTGTTKHLFNFEIDGKTYQVDGGPLHLPGQNPWEDPKGGGITIHR